MGQDASGSLADTVTFSKCKGVSYLKLHQKPKQPRSAKQNAMRAILRFLSEQWKNLSSSDMALWFNLATPANVSNFNAYVSFNLARWRSGLAPSQIPTTDTAGTYGSISPPTATPVSRGVQIDFTVTDPGNRWLNSIYHVASSEDPKRWDLLIHGMSTLTVGPKSWICRPLDPGTYHFTFGASKIHGELWSGDFHDTAVVA